jgi:hypothetical protein
MILRSGSLKTEPSLIFLAQLNLQLGLIVGAQLASPSLTTMWFKEMKALECVETALHLLLAQREANLEQSKQTRILHFNGLLKSRMDGNLLSILSLTPLPLVMMAPMLPRQQSPEHQCTPMT